MSALDVVIAVAVLFVVFGLLPGRRDAGCGGSCPSDGTGCGACPNGDER